MAAPTSTTTPLHLEATKVEPTGEDEVDLRVEHSKVDLRVEHSKVEHSKVDLRTNLLQQKWPRLSRPGLS